VNDLTDQELLRDFVAYKSEAAFAELVRRHVDHVYSAALRMVCDVHLAQDVTQGVFIALAKSASQLTDRPILSGWLHRTAQNIAANTVRSEVRRHTREQEAAAMNELLGNEPDTTWEMISPRLDAALGELDEPDRDALTLRYFERKSSREMAAILGTSEDAAKKRVSRAVERLRESFSKRRVAVAAGGLAALISANAVQSAPAGLAATISSVVLTGTAVQTSTILTATKTIAMTTIQKSIIIASLASVAGTGIYAAHLNTQLQAKIDTLQQQQAPLTAQIQELQQERNDATNQLASLLAENAWLKSDSNQDELLRLRAEVTRMENSQSQQQDDATTSAAKALVAKVNQLKQWLDQHPNEKIPEIGLLSDTEWLREASRTGNLTTDDDFVQAANGLRSTAKQDAARLMGQALDTYIANNNGKLPTDMSQLAPYLNASMDPSVLQRYQLVQSGNLSNISENDPIIAEKSPVDDQADTLFQISATSYSYKSAGSEAYSGSGSASFGPNVTSQIEPFEKNK